MSENVREFTDQNFESDVQESDIPVLVDFGQYGVDLVRL